jgi:hypothetical protein
MVEAGMDATTRRSSAIVGDENKEAGTRGRWMAACWWTVNGGDLLTVSNYCQTIRMILIIK